MSFLVFLKNIFGIEHRQEQEVSKPTGNPMVDWYKKHFDPEKKLHRSCAYCHSSWDLGYVDPEKQYTYFAPNVLIQELFWIYLIKPGRIFSKFFPKPNQRELSFEDNRKKNKQASSLAV